MGGLHVLTDLAVGVAAAQTPAPLPSPSDLAALDPSVSITLLVSSVVLALLAYIGPAVRDRIRPPKPAEPPAQQAVSASALAHAMPGASTAVDQAEVRTSQFIDHLLRQLQASGEREDELEDRLHAKEAEHEVRLRSRDERISQLEQELRRLEGLLWQRGIR